MASSPTVKKPPVLTKINFCLHFFFVIKLILSQSTSQYSTFGATTSKNQAPVDPAIANAQPESALIETATQSPEDNKVEVVAISPEPDSLRFEFEKSDCNVRFKPVIKVVTTDNFSNSSEINESVINLMNRGVNKKATGVCNSNEIYRKF